MCGVNRKRADFIDNKLTYKLTNKHTDNQLYILVQKAQWAPLLKAVSTSKAGPGMQTEVRREDRETICSVMLVNLPWQFYLFIYLITHIYA